MPSTPTHGTSVSFGNTPQASGDSFLSASTGLTEDTRGFIFLDVMANDSGGKAKSLYSLGDGSSSADLLTRDTARTESASHDVSASGATIWITADGQVGYDASTWSDAFREQLQHLQVGQYMQDTFTYAIQLGNGTLSWAKVTLQIAGVNDAPEASPTAANAVEGDAVITGHVTATDPDNGAVLTYSLADDAPAGLTFNADGSFSFDPRVGAYDHLAQGASQDVVVNYIVKDEFNATDTSTLTITVTGTNDAPIAVADTATGGENQPLSIAVLANDTDVDDGHSFTLVSASGAAGKGAVSIDGSHVVFNPRTDFDHLAQGAVETVQLDYTMNDEHGAVSSALVVLTITGENDAPVAAADAATGAENDQLVIDVLANDTDVDDNHVLTLVSAEGTVGKGAVSIEDGHLVFAPGTDFDHLKVGASETVQVAYTIQDEHGAASTSNLSIVITGTNDGPVAAADTAAGEENQALVVDVLANDTDADDDHVLSLVSASAPDGKGSVGIVDGKLAFDPGTDFDHLKEGATETVVVAYTIQDEHGAASNSNLSIVVTGTNDGPVAVADSATTQQNQSIAIDVRANDTDADDDAVLTVVSAAGPGLVSIGGGNVVFDPLHDYDHLAQGASETVQVAYQIQDEHGAASTSNINIVITGENDGPVAVADTAAGQENQTLLVDVLANDTDVDDNHILTLVSAAAPDGKGSVGIVDGKLAFDPGTDFDHLKEGATETVVVAYTIQDEHGAASTSNLSIVITGTNDGPVAVADTATTSENQAIAIDVVANDTDVDDDAVLTLVSASGSVSITDGNVVFDPQNAFDHLAQGASETVHVAYTIQDEHGAASSSVVDILVSGENDGPSAVADSATGDENQVLSIDVLANDTDPDDNHAFTLLSASGVAGKGTVSVVNGQVAFDPGADFDHLAAGASETVQVAYSMQDEFGALSSSTVDILVNGVNDAPDAVNDSASTNEDTSITGNVLTGDSDVDGDALAVSTVGTFATTLGGSITLGANGAFTYNPTGSATLQALNAGQSATDSFTYSISDGNGGSDSATLSIAVSGLAEPVVGGTEPVLTGGVPLGANLELYIRFDSGTASPSTNSWLELGSFSQGFGRAVTSSGGITSVGKVSASDISTMFGSAAVTPDLLELMGKHTMFNGVEVEAYAQTSKGLQLVDQYYFDNAALSGLSVAGNSGSTADAVSFDFSSYTHSHRDLDPAKTAVTTAGYDFLNSKASTSGGPSFTADAITSKQSDVLDVATQLDYYVTYDGAPGWLELGSFATGFSAPVSITGGPGGGISVGNMTAQNAMLALGSSKQLTELSQTFFLGKQIQNVEVEAYRFDGKGTPVLVDEYKFGDVVLTGVSTGNASDNSLTFHYDSYSEGHVAYNATGGIASTTSGGFDFTTGKATSGSTPVADFTSKDLLTDGVPLGANLELYIRFDSGTASPSTNSWLELGSFSQGFGRSVTSGFGGVTSVGKVSASDIATAFGSAAVTPDLVELMGKGATLNGVEVEAYAHTSKGLQLVDQYYFDNAMLSGISVSGGSGGSTGDAVSFDFTSYTHSHRDLDPTQTAVTTAGYDFLAGKASTSGGPSFTGDALTSKAQSDVVNSDLDYYVTYDGAPGWLELGSFNAGFSAPVSVGFGGAISAGKMTAQDVFLALGSSKQLTELSQTFFTGKQLQSFEVEAYGTDGKGMAVLVDEYKFEDVVLTGLSSANATGNSLSFHFDKYSEGHVAYNASGAVASTTSGGFDFTTGKATSGSTPVADFTPNDLLTDGVPLGANLELYIRFDSGSASPSTNSWFELGSFSQSFGRAVSSSGGITSVGKVSASDVATSFGSAAVTPDLLELMGKGATLNGVEVEAYAHSSKGLQLVDQYYFDNAVLNGLNVAGSSGGTGDVVSFDFSSFTHSHRDLDPTKTAVTTAGYDFLTGKTSTSGGPSFTGDALTSKAQSDVVDPGTQLDYYVTYDGAPGWLELGSFSTGFSAPVSIGFGGGISAGKMTAQDAILMLGSSKQLTELSQTFFAGKQIQSFEVEAYRFDGGKGTPVLVDEYKFEDVVLTGLSSANAADNSLSFHFDKYSEGHVTYNATGGVASTTSGAFDFTTGKASAGPTPHGDIDFTL